MNRTFKELLYNKQIKDDLPQQENAYALLIDKVRSYLSQNYAEELSLSITDNAQADIIKNIISSYIEQNNHHIKGFDGKELTDTLYTDMIGFGFLDKYIKDPDVEEIDGNSWCDIEIITKNSRYKIDEHFLNPQAAQDDLRKMTRLGGVTLDESNPDVQSFIANGTRVSAMIPPLVDKESGVVFSIRKQIISKVSKKQLVKWKTATSEMLDFIVFCVEYGVSLGFAGKTSSGKTTDISFVLNAIDKRNRIFCIEETREIDLYSISENGNVNNSVIPTRTRSSDNKALNIDMNDLLRTSLRYTPDVICVAEMRSGEAMVAQEASRTGHVVVTSLHANSARKAYHRILSMCQMSNTRIPTEYLMHFIVEAYPIMVYKKQLKDGSRRIMEIVEAVGVENGNVKATTLYKYNFLTDSFEKVNNISDELAQTMLENGANKKDIERFTGGNTR